MARGIARVDNPLDVYIVEPEVLMIRRSGRVTTVSCAAAMRIHWKFAREPSEEESWGT